jgi:hypothetical protein
MKVNIVLQWMEIISDSVGFPLEAGVWLVSKGYRSANNTVVQNPFNLCNVFHRKSIYNAFSNGILSMTKDTLYVLYMYL